jgi:diaminohydroxyphosphoribosylaminopyrimidine deaminase/5-amino-6-(5-phosphoribosylamino)uracil reductase
LPVEFQMSLSTDHAFMARALRLAERGLFTTDPNPRVGCVIVRDGEVVGEGWHVQTGAGHAEVNALAQAGEGARGATAYVTLEPCCHHGRTPPCTEALISAGVARVVVGMEDPNPQVAGNGVQVLAAAGVEVATGVLAAQAATLNPGFIRRMQTGRPFVRCKLAMSLDGRTAMASGESRWITGEAARRDVHRLRARASAVMTGIDTVLADNPSLNARLEDEVVLQPLRVVLDTRLRLPPEAKLLGLPGDMLVLTGTADASKTDALTAQGAEVVTLPLEGDRLELAGMLQYLGEREINEIHVEAGPTLSGALLQASLVDELVFYVAPHLMGDNARGLFSLPALERMDQRINLSIADIRAVGDDWRVTAIVND